jgi:tRNA threonylcarbamoyl adenosine modification protein YeaZ
MLSLILDASTDRGVIAISNGEEILFSKALAFGYQNSKYLLSELEQAFKVLGLETKDLQLMIAGVGPGSYTGIRVGAMVVKTLSFVHRIPLVAVSSLMGFIPEQEGKFAVLLDAKIGGVYLLKGMREGDQVTYLADPILCALDKLSVFLEDVSIILGPTILALKKKIEPLLNGEKKWQEIGPNPSHLQKLGQKKFEQGDYSRDGQLELIYLRKTQAEIEREIIGC